MALRGGFGGAWTGGTEGTAGTLDMSMSMASGSGFAVGFLEEEEEGLGFWDAFRLDVGGSVVPCVVEAEAEAVPVRFGFGFGAGVGARFGLGLELALGFDSCCCERRAT